MTTILLNGEFTDLDQAKVGVFDAGFQHGVGLFETMTALITGGECKVIGLEEHLQRLKSSAVELGLVRELHLPALEEAVVATVERAGDARQRVRLTLTGGDLNLTSRGHSQEHQPTVMVVAQPLAEYPGEMYRNGAAAAIADLRVNPLDESQGHKTLNYWMRLRELQKAAAKRAGEALVFQVTGTLAGGCVSNVAIVRDNVVLTPIARGDIAASTSGPRLQSPVLPGITRASLLGWAEQSGRQVERRDLTLQDVLAADEVMLCNSIFGVLPVVAVEGREISAGTVGPFATFAIDCFKSLTSA